ncbi:MAG: SDR family oxidoreductase [Pseudomonadota bacterium]
MGRLATKRAVVFGAGSIGAGWGNGKAAAVLFAREGAAVLCVDRNPSAAEETVALIAAEGGRSAPFCADVTEEGAAASAVAEATRLWGGVDVVHYNVGMNAPGGVMDEALADWRRVFAINLDGAFLAAKAAIPAMGAAGGGAFVFVSSVAAVAAGGYAYASYEASKAALNRLCATIAVAHAADGIRANVVMPGLIDTPHVAHAIAGKVADAQNLAARRAAIPPMKRQGTAFDVAQAALFLASDEAAYITGAVLPVDGGLTLMVPSQ